MIKSCKGCGYNFISATAKVYCSKDCFTTSKKQKRKKEKIKDQKASKAAKRKAAIDAIPPYNPPELTVPVYVRLSGNRYKRRDP